MRHLTRETPKVKFEILLGGGWDGPRHAEQRDHRTKENSMARYMLLLRREPHLWKNMSPDEIQKAVVKFDTWRTKLIERGLYAGSEKLADEPGKLIRREKGQALVTDGPYSEAKEVLGGYFAIHASSYDEAVERSEDCPALEYGATVEVRLIDEVQS
jgi:hypothetical protein